MDLIQHEKNEKNNKHHGGDDSKSKFSHKHKHEHLKEITMGQNTKSSMNVCHGFSNFPATANYGRPQKVTRQEGNTAIATTATPTSIQKQQHIPSIISNHNHNHMGAATTTTTTTSTTTSTYPVTPNTTKRISQNTSFQGTGSSTNFTPQQWNNSAAHHNKTSISSSSSSSSQSKFHSNTMNQNQNNNINTNFETPTTTTTNSVTQFYTKSSPNPSSSSSNIITNGHSSIKKRHLLVNDSKKYHPFQIHSTNNNDQRKPNFNKCNNNKNLPEISRFRANPNDPSLLVVDPTKIHTFNQNVVPVANQKPSYTTIPTLSLKSKSHLGNMTTTTIIHKDSKIHTQQTNNNINSNTNNNNNNNINTNSNTNSNNILTPPTLGSNSDHFNQLPSARTSLNISKNPFPTSSMPTTPYIQHIQSKDKIFKPPTNPSIPSQHPFINSTSTTVVPSNDANATKSQPKLQQQQQSLFQCQSPKSPSCTTDHMLQLIKTPNSNYATTQTINNTNSLQSFKLPEQTKSTIIQSRRPRSNSVPGYTTEKFTNKSREGSGKSPKTGQLRRGKWTVEEESYVARVIQDFNLGYLNAPAGTTLRTYLSDKLNCDPMRITKKFTGDACIGKRVFHPAVRNPNNAAFIDKAQAELNDLEERWRRRLEMQQKETARKAATTTSGAGKHLNLSFFKPSHDLTNEDLERSSVVAETASWLDRANSILSNQNSSSISTHQNTVGSNILLKNEADVKKEMQEVQRLIHYGSKIQKSSAELPMLLKQSTDTISNKPNPTNFNDDVSLHSNEAVTTAASYVFNSEAPKKRKAADGKYVLSSSLSTGSIQTTNVSASSHDISPNECQKDFKNHQNFEMATCTSISYSTSPKQILGAQDKPMQRSQSLGHLNSKHFDANDSSDTNLLDDYSRAAEDAATLMGFLTSVRASAAAASNSSSSS